MGDLFIQHMLQDMRTELKAMSRQLDKMDNDIQEIKKQLTTTTICVNNSTDNAVINENK